MARLAPSAGLLLVLLVHDSSGHARVVEGREVLARAAAAREDHEAGRGGRGLVTNVMADCTASDHNLLMRSRILCSSLVQYDTEWCGHYWQNVTAKQDWPNQAMCVPCRTLLVPAAQPLSQLSFAAIVQFLAFQIHDEITAGTLCKRDVFGHPVRSPDRRMVELPLHV